MRTAFFYLGFYSLMLALIGYVSKQETIDLTDLCVIGGTAWMALCLLQLFQFNITFLVQEKK